MKLLFSGLVLVLLLCRLPSQGARSNDLQEPEAFKPKLGDLELSLVAEKHSYRPDDRISLEIKLTNNNAVKDIFIYGTLQFGVRASLMLFRRDAKVQEVAPRFIDSAWDLPPKRDEVSAFVKLLPYHFLGKTYRSTIQMEHMEKPGRYSIWVEYNCPLSTADVEVSPFWGKENGSIKSNVIEIEVRR